ncbi:MAG TPA: aminotransferase class I/II-fold pyridoxal phosphate-dependent enzyme, partial [Gemmatimonadales bacterium]|nr:aminotransferase class I/II-fold pyridoxal phosphate-dependent enzyme [Gemmatimonadales bacterium]
MTTTHPPIPAAAAPAAPGRRATFLPFAPPFLGEEEINEVLDTLRSPWITTGPKTHRFEQEFASFVGAPGALAVNSCTAALHTALTALGVGPGDEVITSTMTFVATVNVIEHVGARPVLVDVAPDTLNLNPHAVAAAITSRTRAIIPVHYAGHPADLHAIRVLARAHGLVILEDAAHALPAAVGGQRIGAAGSLAAFSFYAT